MTTKREDYFEAFKYLKTLDDKTEQSYYDRFIAMKGIYKSILDTDVFVDDKQLTPHDYDRHCMNVFHNIDLLIPDEALVSEADLTHGRNIDRKLNQEHIFYLLSAVLFHDISLVYGFKREDHNMSAKKWILDRIYSINETDLNKLLSRSEANFIADIVYGHRDHKTDNGKEETLKVLSKKTLKTGSLNNSVNVALLGAILRLADELDISLERVRHKKHLKTRIADESREHWEICDFFQRPIINSHDNTQIVFPLDEKLILEYSSDVENIVPKIVQRKDKAVKELEYLKEIVFNKCILEPWRIQGIIIKVDDPDLTKRLKHAEKLSARASGPSVSTHSSAAAKKHLTGSVDQTDDTVENEEVKPPQKLDPKTSPVSKKTDKIEHARVIEIDENFSQMMHKKIISKRLIKDGHFYVGPDHYVRDMIKIMTLLSDPEELREITDKFLEFLLRENCDEKDIQFVADGFPGLIIASSIAFRLAKPFSYIIPPKATKSYTKAEKEIFLLKDYKYIFVTDVMISGSTISSTIDELKKNHSFFKPSDVLHILSVFIRKPINANKPLLELINKDIREKVVALNATLDVEVCSKKNCLFRDNRLITHKYDCSEG